MMQINTFLFLFPIATDQLQLMLTLLHVEAGLAPRAASLQVGITCQQRDPAKRALCWREIFRGSQ